jgi:hypothetical protein
MKRSVAVVSVALLLHAVRPVSAEDLEIAVGSRIRFRAPTVTHGRFEGTLVSLDDSAFTLRLKDQRDLTVVQRSAVERLEIRTREGHRAKGAFFGFLIGAVLGTAAGASSDSTMCGSGISGCNVALGTLFLGPPFAIIGALAAQGAHWERVPTQSVAIWVAPRADRGIEARVSVRF